MLCTSLHLFSSAFCDCFQMHASSRYLTRRKMDNKLSALTASRDLLRVWIHVDLDAFFASVEELDDPSLVKLSAIHNAAPYSFTVRSPCRSDLFLDACQSII